MFPTIIRNIVLVYAAIKSIFSGLTAGIKLVFEKAILRVFFYFLLAMLIIWAIGFAFFHHSISQNWEEIKINNPELSEKTDAIVVLTGGSERIRTALHLIQSNYSDKLFISGVNQQVKLPELLSLYGVSRDDFFKLIKKIDIGFEAKNTIENATEIKNWVKAHREIKSLRLVTSNYHIKRAMLEVKNRLPNLKIIPHPVIPINVRIDKWWKFSSSRNLLLSEYNKLLAAYFRIYLEKIKF